MIWYLVMEILSLHRERDIIRTKVNNINPYHKMSYARMRHIRFYEDYMEQSYFYSIYAVKIRTNVEVGEILLFMI